MVAADIPILKAMEQGFPYPDPTSEEMAAIRVVVDEDDRPLMAAGARKLIELYLWCGPIKKPLARMFALRLLHEDMATTLSQLGYHEAEAFLPPPVAQRFARRLQKSFGWRPNWPSLNRGF